VEGYYSFGKIRYSLIVDIINEWPATFSTTPPHSSFPLAPPPFHGPSGIPFTTMTYFFLYPI